MFGERWRTATSPIVALHQLRDPNVQQKEPEELAQQAGVQPGGDPGGQASGGKPGEDRRENGFLLQKPVFVVGRQGGCRRREKVEQVDPLGLVLVQGSERGQLDQQQRPASDAEG